MEWQKRELTHAHVLQVKVVKTNPELQMLFTESFAMRFLTKNIKNKILHQTIRFNSIHRHSAKANPKCLCRE